MAYMSNSAPSPENPGQQAPQAADISDLGQLLLGVADNIRPDLAEVSLDSLNAARDRIAAAVGENEAGLAGVQARLAEAAIKLTAAREKLTTAENGIVGYLEKIGIEDDFSLESFLDGWSLPGQGVRERLAVRDGLRELIDQSGRFNSGLDRKIAHSLAEELYKRASASYLTTDKYEAAAKSLAALIPVDNGKGKRQINGKTIPPAVERLIASRLSGREVDIAGPAGAWGRLPEIVKQYLTYYGSNMACELTTNCTVGCPFCGLSDKGPIAAKASFDSAVDVMRDFTGRQEVHYTQVRVDTLYWGSDPFDLKWAATETTPERDYTDLAQAHARLPSGRSRALYTSTAVPLTEELRILRYARHFMGLLEGHRSELRFSRTNANTQRVDHLLHVIEALYPRAKDITVNDVQDHVAIRGKKWEKTAEGDAVAWDVTGPNCRDGVVIGVNGADAIIMQGASPDRQSGEAREPVGSIVDGKRIYTIPTFFFVPDIGGKGSVGGIYPDVEVNTIEIDAAGNETVITRTIADDPHRWLLRVAGAIQHYYRKTLVGEAMTEAERLREFKLYIGPTAERLRQHVNSGAGNWVMREAVQELINQGFIGP